MAHLASDGTPYTNHFQMRQHNARLDSQKTPLGKVQPIDVELHHGTSEEEETSPHQVVAEHGPAKVVKITHQDGTHSVNSLHEDGHKHSSQHDTPEDAHDAARALSGVDDPGVEDQDMPDADDVSDSDMWGDD